MLSSFSSGRQAATARIVLIAFASLSVFSSQLASSEAVASTMTDLHDSTEAIPRLVIDEVDPDRVTTRVLIRVASGSTTLR